MRVSHFGEWVSAYIDGQLSAPQADRLLMHIAQCAECADELAAEERARSALLSAADVEPSSDLTERLLLVAGAQVSGTGSGVPRRQMPAELRPQPAQRTFPALTGELKSRSGTRIAVGAFVTLCAGLVGLAILGSPTMVVPELDQAVALSVLAGQTNESAAVQVKGVPAAPIMIRQQNGLLDTSELDGLVPETMAGHDVFVLSQSPLHVVWQSGDTVVDLVSPSYLPEIADAIESYPNEPFGAGLDRRIGRGWAELSQIWRAR